MSPYKPPTTRQKGLKRTLDEKALLHRGWDYTAFCRMYESPKPPALTSLAHIFDVAPKTMREWIKIYKEEQRKSIANRTKAEPAEDTFNLQGGVL